MEPRLLGIASVPVVVDEQAVVGRRLGGLQVASDATVKVATAGERHALVGDVLDESMAERHRSRVGVLAADDQCRADQFVEGTIERRPAAGTSRRSR